MTKIASLQMDEAPVRVGCHEDSPPIMLDNPEYNRPTVGFAFA